MGYLKSGLFISLDGVIESPETWHFPYFNDQVGAVVGEMMSDNDAILLGRQTYDEFAGYWPNANPGDPTKGVMNGTRKYVVSTTITEATWQKRAPAGRGAWPNTGNRVPRGSPDSDLGRHRDVRGAEVGQAAERGDPHGQAGDRSALWRTRLAVDGAGLKPPASRPDAFAGVV
jgi:hypothetical protein